MKYRKSKNQTYLHIFVICFVFPVVPGSILSLSIQCVMNCGQINVLALCTGKEGNNHDGSLLTLLTLPAKTLTGAALTDYINTLLIYYTLEKLMATGQKYF